MLQIYHRIIVCALVVRDRWCVVECWDTQSSSESQCVAHAAAHQPLDIGDGPGIVQLPSAIDECGQPRRVQGRLGVLPTMCAPATHPRVLQTESSARPLPGILLQHRGHKIPSRLAHIMEVLVRKAEVQAADVDAGFLRGFVQKRGDATEHHVSQHADAPHVCRNRHRRPPDELRSSKLWVSKQEVDIASVGGQLDGVAEVDELNARGGRVEVDHDVLRLQDREITSNLEFMIFMFPTNMTLFNTSTGFIILNKFLIYRTLCREDVHYKELFCTYNANSLV